MAAFQTTDCQPQGSRAGLIGIVLNPEDIHIMKKPEHSGMFGDCQLHSEEFDELADPEADLVQEGTEEEAAVTRAFGGPDAAWP